MPKKIFEIEWKGKTQRVYASVIQNDLSISGYKNVKVKEIPTEQEKKVIFDKIKDILAQPIDRISHITVEGYAELRQSILNLIEKPIPPQPKLGVPEKINAYLVEDGDFRKVLGCFELCNKYDELIDYLKSKENQC